VSALATNVVSFIHKVGLVPLSPMMHSLVDIVTTDAIDEMLVSLCRSFIPDNLTRSLLDQIASEVVIKSMSYYVVLTLFLYKCIVLHSQLAI